MDQLRRFSGAAAACAVAVIAAIVAVLALTVWKPTQQISATVTPQQPVVITREGLFQLEGGEVTVTAASASGKQVTMVQRRTFALGFPIFPTRKSLASRRTVRIF